MPGTTRDRLYGDAEWNGVPFTVVDTGGLEIIESQKRRSAQDEPEPLSTASVGFIEEIREQAEIAIAEADVIVMLVDVLDGLTPADEDVADVLRRTDKPVLVAANKADNLRPRAGGLRVLCPGAGRGLSHLGAARHRHRRPAGRGGRCPAGGRGGRGAGSAQDRPGGPAQRGQVVAAQQAAGRGTGHRQRHPRHHPRRHRHLPDLGGPAGAAHRHGRHPPPGPHRAGHRKVQRPAGHEVHRPRRRGAAAARRPGPGHRPGCPRGRLHPG